MANIYQLQQDLLAIFDELEENGGELTPELEKQLAITEESFKSKVEDYTKVIHHYQDDLAAIKAETDRLKRLKESKEKTIERLKKVVLEAVNKFGETNKNGVKFIDFGTGKVSTRNTQAVQLYDDNIEHIVKCLNDMLDVEVENNQLDVISHIDKDVLIDKIASTPMGGAKVGIGVSDADLDHVKLCLTTGFSLNDILDGTAWPALKEVIKNNPHFVLASNINKTDMKFELNIDGACAPKIAKLVNNQSLTIK